MNDKKIIISFVVLTFLILGGGVYILNQSATSPAVVNLSQNAKVEVSEKTFDWGEIAYSGPNATKTFTIKNAGTDVLRLTNVKTSCACTTAQVKVGDKTSPSFGMHTTSSWIGEVPSGKEAQLTVVFDQDFHGPTGVGPMERLISVETNDLTNPKLEFSLKGVVVK